MWRTEIATNRAAEASSGFWDDEQPASGTTNQGEYLMGGGGERKRGWRQWAFLPLALLITVAMLASALAPATIAKPPRGSDVNAEIVGGTLSPQGEYPFLAFILTSKNGEPLYQCGGSLIAPSFVLTAAHCLEDDNGRQFKLDQFTVILGKADLNQFRASNRRGVVAATQHPNWNADTFKYDVAVLELDRAVPRSVAVPINIVNSSDVSFNGAGSSATVAGWGATVAGGKPVLRLRAADLHIIGNAVCDSAYARSADLYTATVMLCAAAKGKDSCQGDSGGPLFVKDRIGTKKVKTKTHGTKAVPIYRNVQIGIVSFGAICADPRFPGVYTRLSAPKIKLFVTALVTRSTNL